MAGEVNEDLLRERSRNSFNILELTQLLDGSEEKTRRRKELEKEYYEDPELQDTIPIDYLTQTELYDVGIRKSLHMFHKAMDLADPQEILTIADAIMHESSPLTVHFVMFLPALMGMATEEQQAKWLPLALQMKMIGSYAQTELGHGTFLRGLQTTATYDPKTEEFVLHTPTLSAIKWWPGTLGKTANHAVVLAQLYTKGKCHGIHPFMVQIRSMEDHQPLSGITVGEIGPKMGMKGSDNGFLKLDKVRIPRENMLMKNAQVSKGGDYIKPKSDKLNYGTMVFVRVLLIDYVGFNIARAVTIAMRYSAVRRQSEIVAGERESQILDYQAQQHKLFPVLAMHYAIKASFLHLIDTYKNTTHDMEKGNLGLLPELHAMSSGIKAFSTEVGSKYIEQCRLSCGGHGYLLISGLPRIYAATVAACTYEGENTVLYLQTARYLLKVANHQVQTSSAESETSYLAEKHLPSSMVSRNISKFDDLVTLYREVAYRAVHQAATRVHTLTDTEQSPDHAWNLSQVDLIRAAKAHIQYYIVKKYSDWVQHIQVSKALYAALNRLCYFYMLYNICEQPGAFIQVGVTTEMLSDMNNIMMNLLSDLRPDAVSFVDAFDFHDFVLNSALGSYDGKVYERLFDWAQKTPLNKTQVHESYYKYLQPVIKSKL